MFHAFISTILGGAMIAAAACSAPALFPDLERAESLERGGDIDAALEAYTRAMASCRSIRSQRRRRQTCASAYLGRAALLERAGRIEQAAAAYQSIARHLRDDPASVSRGLFVAGKLAMRLKQDKRAYRLLWNVVTEFPDENSAPGALRLIVTDGRARNATQLVLILQALANALHNSGIGDNLYYHIADLSRNEFDDAPTALRFLDTLVQNYPLSGLRDEALWYGAELSRKLGDPRGAAKRYRLLLATREVALGAGSYFSIWLDNAQLALGIVLRDELGDLDGALTAFAQLPQDYPHSILRDDAMWERAVTYARGDRTRKACAALDALKRKWPDSKYEQKQAPALRGKLSCTTGAKDPK